MKNEKYGLATAITMIIGICIGSGIFFKSDNILVATNGSIFLGVIVFILAAFSIIFGGLCISELASRTARPGGAITYFEEFVGKNLACGFAWFQILIYYPTLIVVVAWVVGIYSCILFNINGSLEIQLLIGFIYFTICYFFNTISPRLGGLFQNASTIIKLIPLALIAVLGLLFADPQAGLSNISPDTFRNATWVTAIGPIAYSFDGWIVSTSIAHEIKEPTRNLPKALIFAPIIVLIIYVTYFIGISYYVGPTEIIQLKDAHVYTAASRLFGDLGAKIIIIFVIISVMGTVNGLILGFIRLPYSLALRQGMIPLSSKLKIINEKYNISINSAILCYVLTLFWTIVHYLTMKLDLLPNSDISEISIVMSYMFYIMLYYNVFRLYKKNLIKGIWRGIIIPIIATIGSLFIFSSGIQNTLFFYYAGFCIIIIAIAMFYYTKNSNSSI